MQNTWKGLLKDLFTLAFLIVVVVIPIRVFVVSPFIVDGDSMLPTFKNLDYLIVDEIIYNFRVPARGDVIVLRSPSNPSIFYIKRIIGLPNETVSINRGIVTVITDTGDKFPLEETYIFNEDATYTKNVSLNSGEYFVMGDNRPNSYDSRMWGPLSRKNIVGRVDLRLLPIKNIGFFPGIATYVSTSSSATAVVSPS